jgi:hypothetical protein
MISIIDIERRPRYTWRHGNQVMRWPCEEGGGPVKFDASPREAKRHTAGWTDHGPEPMLFRQNCQEPIYSMEYE